MPVYLGMLFRLLFLLPVVLWLSACRKENRLDCFKGNGEMITVTRDPGSFQYITIHDNLDVFIRQGPQFRVEVTSGSKIIDDIRTEVKDSALVVENLNVCNFVRGYKKRTSVTITTPQLIKLTHMGVGPVRFDEGFSQETLRMRTESSGDVYISGTYTSLVTSAHGNGDIYLTAKTHQLYVYTYGTNFLFADKLDIDGYVFVQTLSLGDVIINGTRLGLLDYDIQSQGNVRCSGNPNVRNVGGRKDAKGRFIRED